MAVFLSEEWVAAVRDALNANDEVTGFAAWAYVTLEHVATDVPGRGEVRHWRRFADGKVDVELGAPGDAPDAVLTTTYEDAVAINKGELDLQAAFARGKLKVDGDVTKLLQHQAELAEVAATVHAVPTEY